MKKIIISAFSILLAFSTLAIADEKSEKVEEIKQQILQRLDKELAMENQIRDKQTAIMSQFRSCIQVMKNENDFNACNNTKNEAFKKLKLELEKSYLDSKKKEIANEEKRLNEEMKAPKK
jgi:hypothetical protein